MDIRKEMSMRRNKNSRAPKEVPKLAFPWSMEDDYFNGDMFENWLNSKLDPNDPYFKLQWMIKTRETAIYNQFVDEATRILKKQCWIKEKTRW